MKVTALDLVIEIEPDEMKKYMYEAAQALDETFYEMLTSAPAYGDAFDEWERQINMYTTMKFDNSNDYIFADFILYTTPWKGFALVPICKKWLSLCDDNCKLKPLLQECIDKNVQLFWE